MNPGRSMGLPSVVVLAAVVTCLAVPVNARSDDKAPSFPRRQVVVLPVRDFRVDPDALFWTGEKAPPADRIGAELVETALVVLTREPELAVHRPPEVLPRGQGDGDRGIVARGFLHLGIELYRNIRLRDAIDALEKGIEAARSEYLDVLDPKLVSDLYLYLGLSYLEEGSTALAHVAFKNLFFVRPGRVFLKGYFPVQAEQAILAAAVDFQKTFPKDWPLGSAARTTRFALSAGARQLVYVYLVPWDGGSRVTVRVFGPSGRGDALAEEFGEGFPLKTLDNARERVSRTLSAWLACTDLPSRLEPEQPRPDFYMDTSGAYSLFLKYPTRNVFHNVGFGVGLSYQILENLDFFTRLNLFTSFPDKFNDLVEGYTAFRAILGVGYTLRGDWGRMFVHTGFDFQYLSDFASSTNPNCKFFGVDSGFCADSEVKHLPYRFLGGINVTLGANVTISGPIYLLIQAGVTAYFFPAGLQAPLNYPLTAEIGLGYAFD